MRGKRIHKGRTRKFTAPEEIDRQLGLIRGDNITEGGSSLKESEDGNVGDNVSGDNDEDDDSDSEDENVTGRHKGVSHLIEVCNPNHIKGSNSVVPSKKELIASSKAVVDPLKLQSESELAINLARLQLVRKERELAAQKLEQERQAREAQRLAAAKRAAEAKLQTGKQQKSGGRKQASTAESSKQKSNNRDKSTPASAKSELAAPTVD
uniref:Casein kinase substrate phosphoprotein PP28 domain-containing protein n=1 Tax=Trichobilharzia regenti TaxID=157069 RepID=A0AA85IUM4_TRIRE|nr:unnamed protein product [Trichobilharzia regenti]